jgi:hypothetical protein
MGQSADVSSREQRHGAASLQGSQVRRLEGSVHTYRELCHQEKAHNIDDRLITAGCQYVQEQHRQYQGPSVA